MDVKQHKCPKCGTPIEAMAGPWITQDGRFTYKASFYCWKCSEPLAPETIEACTQCAMLATMLHNAGKAGAAKLAAQGHIETAKALARLDSMDPQETAYNFMKYCFHPGITQDAETGIVYVVLERGQDTGETFDTQVEAVAAAAQREDGAVMRIVQSGDYCSRTQVWPEVGPTRT